MVVVDVVVDVVVFINLYRYRYYLNSQSTCPQILNAILVWGDTPGIKILEITDKYVLIDSPKGTATVILKDDTYEVTSSSEQLKTKIDEVIKRALAEVKSIWLRGREWFAPGR
ncbi:MAG: hypothetical protein ABR985_20605 [Methanotrichaceae archaeon]